MSKETTQNPGDPTPAEYPYKSAPVFPKQPYQFKEGTPLHACLGLNACKGLDRYGPEGPNGDGKTNECAGQGYCSTTADHQCHVRNDCRNQGGCGLYGTAEELDNPGVNDCKSLGSCATPINAERFSTNGPNQGYSVWARARKVFEERWDVLREEAIEAASIHGLDIDPPKSLGSAPAPFTEIGPPYLWVSENNQHRGNMTSCGASGLSGAGGCG